MGNTTPLPCSPITFFLYTLLTELWGLSSRKSLEGFLVVPLGVWRNRMVQCVCVISRQMSPCAPLPPFFLCCCCCCANYDSPYHPATHTHTRTITRNSSRSAMVGKEEREREGDRERFGFVLNTSRAIKSRHSRQFSLEDSSWRDFTVHRILFKIVTLFIRQNISSN